MKKHLFLLTCILVLAMLLTSCRKNKSYDLGPDVNASNDVILSLSSSSFIFNLLIKARMDTSVSLHSRSQIDGAFVTYDAASKVYSFEFGSFPCPDSVSRTGLISVRVSGDIFQKGTWAKVSFLGYYEDYGKVLGSDSIVNEGLNSLNQLEFFNHVSKGSWYKVRGDGTINVNLDLSFKVPAQNLVGGQNVVFNVAGNLAGVSSKGHPFTATIRDSLEDAFNCPWIKGGIINMNVADADIPSGAIDFGFSDGCSDIIWYYFNDCSFKVRKNQYYLEN